ncbi:hypothetical protein Cgig2_023737 [Carnegiea gigantea]|uniref:Helicase-like transcription factor CHR28 n=1 Tax=Carnegiea gigantea TaxID=171969 RepID=A0A9Q1JW00_9CARY|nr:hypothetical protein Cgig2_023737 [Carnegiea gigantea]
MPDPGDSLHGFIKSTWRIYSFVSEWICCLTFRQSADSARSPSSSYFEWIKGQGNHCSDFFNMEPIDISSSDSDFDTDDDVEAVPSPEIKRRLPSWSSGSHANANISSSRGSTSRGTPSYAIHRSQADPGPSTSYNVDAELRFPQENGNGIQSKRYDEGLHGNNSTYAQNPEYQQDSVRRTLPPSLQPLGMRTKQNNSWDNLSRNHGGDNNGGFYHPIGLSSANARSYGKESFSWVGDEDLHNHSRILPHTLMRGKPVSLAQYASNDPFLNTGFGEERVSGDERLIFQAALQDLSQPKVELDLPSGLLSVPLLRHQKIALAWMVQKESRTVHCLGGILADDQGLGKTISTIALIQKQRSLQKKSQSKEDENQNAEALDLDDDDDNGNGNAVKKREDLDGTKCKLEEACSNKAEILNLDDDDGGSASKATVQMTKDIDRPKCRSGASSSNQTFQRQRPAAGTLIVCPATVLRQWARELDDKRKHPCITGKKGKKGRKLADSSLYSPAGALARVSWFRVVLDEAQTIKNHRTQTARACCGLRAKRRWCLSGTPIQNSVDELYSYFRFLRHDLYSSYKTFCEAIKIPISRDPNMGYKKLQAVLKTLLLRRTKETLLDGQPIISLPPKFIKMKTVNFSTEERAFYTQLEAESRSQFKAYAAAGTVNQNYANILLMILRLRQACDHPLLVKGFSSYSARKTNLEKARRLPKHRLIKLLNEFGGPSVLCNLCSDPPEDAVITICGHVFCYQCVADYVTGDDNMCPVRRCREQLSDDVIFSEATLRSCLSDDAERNLLNDNDSSKNQSILSTEYSSSKIKAALEILLSHRESNNPYIELDGLEDDKDNSLSPQYRRLDGSMSLAARDRAVREFNTDPEVTVMLMSLKAGNLGLNMVAACHVILLDLWWNPTTEDQAIDRAHRIGQTRPVIVSRITIKDTVEDRILALQEEKRKMVASAFGEDRVGVSATRLTVDDLRYLFLGSRAVLHNKIFGVFATWGGLANKSVILAESKESACRIRIRQ